MSEHKAIVKWSNNAGAEFPKGKFSREHTWEFDGGVIVPASAAPTVVPAPFSNPANVDPEEAFVASISSCHMLTFLYVAGKAGFQVKSYEDEAVGVMTKNERGAMWVSEVSLKPKIVYAGEGAPEDVESHLHHEAHELCFIANSVKTNIEVNI